MQLQQVAITKKSYHRNKVKGHAATNHVNPKQDVTQPDGPL